MKTKKYIITLQPLGNYFFGGENTFGEDSGDSYKYFARSETMPQAGTLIGMLRYEILRRSGALDGKVPRNQWKGLIGAQSFSLTTFLNSDTQFNFGLISAISPVFLSDGLGKYYTPMPADHNISYNKKNGRSYYAGEIRQHTVHLDNFTPKTYLNKKGWIDTGGQELKETPFIFSERPGIIKNENYKTKDDEECYYKQQVVSLKNGFRFIFQLETPTDNALFEKEKDCFVNMGADRSMFAMHITPCETNFSLTEQFSNLSKTNRCLLLGDTYLPAHTCVDFIWGDSKNFRSIESLTSEEHSWKRPKKSILYHLLKPGGTIYGDKQAIEKLLNMEALRKAGFNYYV